MIVNGKVWPIPGACAASNRAHGQFAASSEVSSSLSALRRVKKNRGEHSRPLPIPTEAWEESQRKS